MAKILSSCTRPKLRAYRQLSVLHPVILNRLVARHRSWCPAFGRWLWFGRVLHVLLWVRSDDSCGWVRSEVLLPLRVYHV